MAILRPIGGRAWNYVMGAPVNEDIAAKLRQMADVLESQQADGYRVAAYRSAARTLDGLANPIDEIFREKGLAGLVKLPGIGRGIAAAIVEMVMTGRWAQLDRLEGTLEPRQLFRTVPGVGPELSERIFEELHIDTLEALELAAHDGRLEQVSGIGERRAAAIRAAVSERLGHRHVRTKPHGHVPSVGILFDVDREYRQKADRGELRRIAPKRFNPRGEAWLPVLHTKRADWELTALYSNTQRAHELGKTHDWVVIYYHREGESEAQCTIVTETRGALAGRRVVRGREGDCVAYYAAANRD